ncbi:hypothetical protein CH306_17705 [Rhodococcus sp. 15-725-2-2b]|nr:hypothetical protein CH276_15350 [Rhodococcus sp. 06-470-2]OZC64516.1 hypothetical protein CH277_17610 [Rhodococcus sp. 06-469-3-2]OZC88047.1 hypothetical protein CH282_07800 [Rhodococcus sp. 06-418-1B]OZD51150.1 hypothetical protein CH264_02245 [Rhodococcus sp. 06-1477-1A]OZE32153.1 hypothetical protein CH278_15095 [Rhodococcus sp. 05-2254-5]OZE58114.1 hypothetical protein CH265_22940 [Rhodococcus sp. 05-2221-1B]OZE59576.1 hypothetical protein CH269_06880 [Rhodococcus sp. 05-2254-1]OZE71
MYQQTCYTGAVLGDLDGSGRATILNRETVVIGTFHFSKSFALRRVPSRSARFDIVSIARAS